MKAKNNTILFAVYMFISMVALFFIMKLFGWEKISELRLLNVFIVAFFSYRLAKLNATGESNRSSYLGNLSSLMLANLIAVFASAIALLIYVTAIDKTVLESIGNGFFLGNNLTINQVVIAVVLEGSAVAAIVSFTIMQYWKNTNVKSHSKKVN